jgi:polysaccharide export outer membrane protein
MLGLANRAVTAVAWVLLAGLGAPALAAQEPPPETSSKSVAGGAAGTAGGSEYIIGPGDSLQVFIWRNPELSTTVPVRPDGKISTPLVEDMVAVGKTPSQLARDIEVVLAEYIRSPQVNVILTNAVSTFSQVRVLGQVAAPQAVPYREGMTVLDAVLAVGGLGEFAAGNRGKIVRVIGGKQQEIKVRIGDLVNKGDVSQNVPLRPGDVLVVPESRF